MQENGFKLPTPKSERSKKGNLGGEVEAIYGGMRFDQRMKYFTGRNAKIDDIADQLKAYGFNYDSAADFLADFADNVAGRKTTYSNGAVEDAARMFGGDAAFSYALRPQQIDEQVAKNISSLREKIAGIRDNKLPTDRESIFANYGNELVPVAKLNDKAFDYYKENYGATSPYVYTSEAYAIDHHFNNHDNTELSRYLALPDTIYDPDNVKDVSTDRGSSQAFMKKYDKWHISTLKPENVEVDSDGKLVLFKNYYRTGQNLPYRKKADINFSTNKKSLESREDAIPSIVSAPFESPSGRRFQEFPDVQDSKLYKDAQSNYRQSQENITPEIRQIRRAVSNSANGMYKNAARKANIRHYVTANEASTALGVSIPGNAEAFVDGKGNIVFVDENLKDARRAVNVLLHEAVGHNGLRELLGERYNGFVRYVENKYKGTPEWNEIAARYEATGADNFKIAEEMLGKMAEFRELSDPSMWRRMLEAAKRKLRRDGVSETYANMLDEKILRDAITAGRQWASGRILANNKWQGVNTRIGRDAGDDVNYSLVEDDAVAKSQRANGAREMIRSSASRLKQATVDAFAPLADVERAMYGQVRGAEESAWKSAMLTRNLDAIMYNVLEVGGEQYDRRTGTFKTRKNSEALNKIFESVKGDFGDFEKYALAKSAIERLRRRVPDMLISNFKDENFIRLFGFSKADAQAWIKKGKENSKVKNAFERLQKFFREQREFMYETGLVSEQFRDTLNEFQNYVPFFREIDKITDEQIMGLNDESKGPDALSGQSSTVKKFEGSQRKIKPLAESVVNQARKVLDAGFKNVAMQRSISMLSEAGMAKRISVKSEKARAYQTEMKRALEKSGLDVSELTEKERLLPLEVFAEINPLDEMLRDNIVSVRVNGHLQFYDIADPELLVAVKNFGAAKLNPVWKLLTAPKAALTWGVTHTPDFAIRNFLRDTMSNAVLLGDKFLPSYLGKVAKSAVKVAFGDEAAAKIRAAGAGGGYWYSPTGKSVAKKYSGTKTQKIGKYTVGGFEWLLNKYERVLSASEQANRVAVYENALKNGASQMEAAFQAMDVLNFGMRGSGIWTGRSQWAKGAATVLDAIVRITPFLNARIQGLYKIYRELGLENARSGAAGELGAAAKTRAVLEALSRDVMMKGMMTATAAVLYSLYANSSTDDDNEKWFEKLPVDDKNNYWYFYVGNNELVRIPKPFEVGFIFGTIPELATDAFIQKNPQIAKALWEGVMDQLQFDPLGNPIADTFREQISNRDSFTRMPIVEYSDRELEPIMQYGADTSAGAKAIAKVFNGLGLGETWLASPARWQNVISNFMGSMTKYVTAASNGIVEAVADVEAPTSRYATTPFFENVYNWAQRNTKTMRTRNTEDFYELRAHARALYASARTLRLEQRLDEMENLLERKAPWFDKYEYIEAINTLLSENSRKRRKLGETKTYGRDELVKLDDELMAERNRILGNAEQILSDISEGKVSARNMRFIRRKLEAAAKGKKESRKARIVVRQNGGVR